MRTETDFLGSLELPIDALYGIHSLRATQNFPYHHERFHPEWYRAMGWVKKACYLTYSNFKKAALSKFVADVLPIQFQPDELIEALIASASEISNGEHFEHFVVPAIQGGAGTSINLNINEILANATLLKLGHQCGNYQIVDPIEQANIYQSTNDVVPTALRVAAIGLLVELETVINQLRTDVEKLERKHRDQLRVAYTQMQAAVPSSYGLLFSSYNEALSRDWWRISKCFERIKVVNLGGGAAGTGLAIPRYYIMEVVHTLQQLTKLPIARSENLADATNNLDSFVEVHAVLKSHAVNLEKMVSDLRLLSSDLLGHSRELSIPQKQVGSSIMPGKVNPVIPEYIISCTHKVYANDNIITNLCAQGCLDLNAYLPSIGHALLESLKLLISADLSLRDNLINGIEIHGENASNAVYTNKSIATALNPIIGYHKAALLAKEMEASGCTVFEANAKLQLLDTDVLLAQLRTGNLLKLGFSLADLIKH